MNHSFDNADIPDRGAFLHDAVDSSAILPFVYCYPPRTAYREGLLDLESIWALDGEHSQDINIYLHIPFCRYRCSFCALYTITTQQNDKDIFREYCDRLKAELFALAPGMKRRVVRTVFIGGGTPTTLGVPFLLELFDALTRVFPNWRETAEEVSIEASPDSVCDIAEQLDALVAAGVNRISLGVQSFDEPELRSAGRSAARTSVIHRSLDLLRRAGVTNIGMDLIVGLAGQTDHSFGSSLDSLLEFGPDTASIYMLNPRSNSPLGRVVSLNPIANATLYERMRTASDRLRTAGYSRETSAQFKLATGGLLQKKLYFGGASVLGLGSGARSYTATAAYLTGGGDARTKTELVNFNHSPVSLRRTASHILLDPEEQTKRSIILSLHDLRVDLIPTTENGSMQHPYRSVLEEAKNLGLMRSNPESFSLTEEGFIFRDLICWSLFSDTSLASHAASASEFPDEQRFLSISNALVTA